MPYYVTFYSYKGGVGRTLALVNVAVALATKGKSVIIWEVDLEAPGLLEIEYFASLRKKAKGGMIDLLADADADAGRLVDKYMLEHPDFEQGRLRVLPAGKPDGSYSRRYAEVDWDALFGRESTGGAARFEEIQDELAAYQPDFVLIDARTGLTDIGGICTVLLPDAVMLLYRLGRQDAAGLRDIYKALGDSKRLGKVRSKELKLLLAATMIPSGFPVETKEIFEASELKPHYRIPLEPKLLIEEEIWTARYPEEAISIEYSRMATDLIQYADVKKAEAASELRADERVKSRFGEGMLEKGSAFEFKVAKVLRLLGFDVQTNVSIKGRQIDFVAVQKDPLRETRFLGECKDHAAAQGVETLDALHSRLVAYRQEFPTAQGLLIARNGFTKDAQAQAPSLGITLRRYEELMDGLVDLGNYVSGLLSDVQGQDIERLYVEPDVFAEDLKETLPLQEYVGRWLADGDAVHMSLLGDYGTGKSWFTRRLAADLARKYQHDPAGNRCPIRIDLRTAAKALSLENVLYEHFQKRLGKLVNSEAVLHLLEEGRFVLIFDAFDEMATQAFWDVTVGNFRELARAASGKAKVILTCRTHFFRAQDEVQALVEGKGSSLSAEGTSLYKEVFGKKGFSVAYLRDFSEGQIREYLAKAGAERVGKLLETVGGLKEVATRPVLLEMVVKSAPQLENRTEIRLASLYEAYTEEWLARADWRSMLDREGRRRLAQDLAFRLWETDEARLHHAELRRAVAELLPDRARNLAEVDVFDNEVRTASFFTRDAEGNYGFSHRSFLEFFVAQGLARRMGPGACLDMRRLSPEVISFLLDLSPKEAIQSTVWGVLESGYERRRSENALLLYAAGKLARPPRMILQGAQLAGFSLRKLDLRGAEFDGADLTGADLTGAVLRGASFTNADLTEALLDEVDAEGASFARARLIGARLERADLRRAKFEGADLSFALCLGSANPFAGAILFGAALEKSDVPKGSIVQGFGLCTGVAYHPNGKLLAIGAASEILIADVETGTVRRRLSGHQGWVRSVAWRGDGERLASGSEDQTVRVWEGQSGRLLRTLEGHQGLVLSVAWRGDGERLASGSEDQTVRVWEGQSGRLLRTLEGNQGRVWSVAWRGDGEQLASGSGDQTVRVWEGQSGKLLRTLEGHQERVLCVAWRGGGERLASGSADQSVRVWEGESGKLLRTLEGHQGVVRSVAWCGDGEQLASGSDDKTMRVWEVESGKLLRTLEGHQGVVRSVVWRGDGEQIASGSADNTVRVWEGESGKLLRTLEGHQGLVRSVAWRGDGERLASGSDDNTVRVWEGESGKLLRTLEGHQERVWSVAWRVDGERLASGSDDKTVRVWEGESGKLLRTLEGHQGVVRSVAWRGDGERLASGSDDQTVRVWEGGSGKLLRTLEGHRDWIRSVTWRGDGERLASGSDDNTVRVWEGESGKLLRTLEGHQGWVLSVAWGGDGERLASGSDDKTVRVWEGESGKLLGTLEGHQRRVRSVAWSGDGKRLASGSDDETVRLWEGESGKLLRTLEAPTPVWSVDWRGYRIAAGCWDGSTIIWDSETGERLSTLYGFDDGAWLALFPNNEYAGDDRGKSRLMFQGDGWAMLPSRLYPEKERRIADLQSP